MNHRLQPLLAWVAAVVCLLPAPALAAGSDRQNAAAATTSAAPPPVPHEVRIVTSTPLGPNFGAGLESEISLRKGVSSLVAGNPSRAAEALERSIAIRPDRPSAHILLGVSLLSAGSPRAIGEFPLAVRALLTDFESQARFSANLILSLLCGIAFVLIGTLTASILRALPSVSHEITELLPPSTGPGIRRSYAIVLLSAPILLLRPWAWPAGLAWLLLLFALLVRRALGRIEKGFAVAGVLLVALCPTLLVLIGLLAAPSAPRSLAFAVAHANDPLFRSAARSQIETALREWRSGDTTLLLDLAAIYREEGRVAEAADLYRKILELNGRHAAAQVNLGNILYARGDTRGAAETYRKALEVAPKSAAAHFNIGQALMEDFEISEAKAHIHTASSINFDFTQSLTRSTNDRLTVLVDETPTARDRWRWLFENRKALLGVAPGEAGNAVIGWLAPSSAFGSALLAALLVLAVLAGRALLSARPCAGCGTPVCRKCRVRLSRRNFCSACAAIAQDTGPADRVDLEKAKRFRKANSLARIVSLLLAMLLPGAGHVYLERRKVGIAVLFIAGIAFFFMATGGKPLKPLPQLDREIFPTIRTQLLGLFLVAHAIVLAHFVTLARRRLA